MRTVQPVMEEIDREVEEAAATLGASRFQTITRVHPAGARCRRILTGFALAFARAVGEYGSVIFIAGNMPFVSEIAPLLIVIKLEEFNYAGATAIAAIMLVDLLRHAARHQPDPGLEPQEVRQWLTSRSPPAPCRRRRRRATSERPLARWLLIGVAVVFLG